MAPNKDWFRCTTWTTEDQAAFASRLARSRMSFHKAQYLRIQALHLEQDATPPLYEAALALLDQLLREFPDPSQLVSAHHQRARCLASLHRHGEAIETFRRALSEEHSFRNIQTHAYLDFAEFVLAIGRTDLYPEVLELITMREQPEAFPLAQYRVFASAAFLSAALERISDARVFATQALAAAAKTESPFRWHRKLGLVETTEPDIQARLWQLARSV